MPSLRRPGTCAHPLNRRRYHRLMVDGAARRAGWLARLAVLAVLVTGCERSVEPDAQQPRSATTAAEVTLKGLRVQEYPVPAGSRPHDVAPAADGRSVWYTAQGSGQLGLLDPATGESRLIRLGDGSAPHGVIVGPDGAPWVTDGGLNAIVRVHPRTGKVDRYPLPSGRARPTSTPPPSVVASCGSAGRRGAGTARPQGRPGRGVRRPPGSGSR